MAKNNNYSNVISFIAIALGIGLTIYGVMEVGLDSLVRSLIMAFGLSSMVFGIIGYLSYNSSVKQMNICYTYNYIKYKESLWQSPSQVKLT